MHAGDFGLWNTESLRLTLFHSTDAPVAGLWERLMGTDPESSESKPREGTLQEQGTVDGNRLLLAAQPGRLDWNLLPSVSGPEHRGLPILTDTSDTVPLLERALTVSLGAVTQVPRLAFGAGLLREVSSPDEGIGQLAKCLPQVSMEGQSGQDFIYQSNRRRRSSHARHVQINRLAKWQTEAHQGGEIVVSPQGTQLRSLPPSWVVRLILDINTAPESNAIAVDRMPDLFAEFVAFAREIASEGDVP